MEPLYKGQVGGGSFVPCTVEPLYKGQVGGIFLVHFSEVKNVLSQWEGRIVPLYTHIPHACTCMYTYTYTCMHMHVYIHLHRSDEIFVSYPMRAPCSMTFPHKNSFLWPLIICGRKQALFHCKWANSISYISRMLY